MIDCQLRNEYIIKAGSDPKISVLLVRLLISYKMLICFSWMLFSAMVHIEILQAKLPVGMSQGRLASIQEQMTEEAAALVAERLLTHVSAMRPISGRQLRRAA